MYTESDSYTSCSFKDILYFFPGGVLINIIVTGGAGFIGSNFIFYMLANHPAYRIICLDKLTYAGNLSTLEPVMKNPSFRFVQADICDREAVDKLFEEEHPDIVVNFAAESHVDRSIEKPGVSLQTNIMGTATLMNACRKYGIRRYHQISTDEVYGDLTFADDVKPFSEGALIRPSSPYSSSKASADLLVMAYHRTYGLPVSFLSVPGKVDSADACECFGREAVAGVWRRTACTRLAVC